MRADGILDLVGIVARIAALLAALGVASCGSGTLYVGADADCAGSACRDGDVDGAATDPCDTIQCPTGQSCLDGRCRTADQCAGVVCPNPGEVCDPRDGSCQSGAADDDGDGVTIAAGDCDDGDASVHPGASETCDGVDQDCDREVDDGFADADGDGFDVCGFGNPAQADCDDSDASAHPGGREECDGDDEDCDGAVDEGLDPRPCSTECGDGVERCEGGDWSACSAPGECDCSPTGAEESEGCGACGSRSHTCGSDLTWSEWGACEGESICTPGSLDTQTCGLCGRQERTCTAACAWPADWGPCTGEGVCAPGSLEAQGCGNCGRQERSCTAGCAWPVDWGPCTGEGECAAGTGGGCTTSCGSAGSRTCSADCRWGACAAPAETCNGADDDCDGQCDEGCRIGVHRSVNSFDHFYTTNLDEAGCCGYTIESANYFYISATEVAGTTGLYRCVIPSTGDHFVSTSSVCEEPSYVVTEGLMGYIAWGATCGAVPLYRLRSGEGDHFHTTSAAERDACVSGGWVDEGISGYVWTSP
jgi:hypothetical protein